MLGFSPLGVLPLGSIPGQSQGAIFAVLYADPDTFGTNVIAPGPVTVTGVLHTDPDSFGTNVLSASYTVTGAIYSDADTFGTHAITVGPVTVSGVLYADPDTFGTNAVSATYQVRPALYQDPDTFYRAFVYTPLIEYVSPGHDRCMRCGFEYGRSKLRREWTGLLVCVATCWEPQHPQMSLRGVPDRQNVPWSRPDPEPVFLSTNQVTADDL